MSWPALLQIAGGLFGGGSFGWETEGQRWERWFRDIRSPSTGDFLRVFGRFPTPQEAAQAGIPGGAGLAMPGGGPLACPPAGWEQLWWEAQVRRLPGQPGGGPIVPRPRPVPAPRPTPGPPMPVPIPLPPPIWPGDGGGPEFPPRGWRWDIRVGRWVRRRRRRGRGISAAQLRSFQRVSRLLNDVCQATGFGRARRQFPRRRRRRVC